MEAIQQVLQGQIAYVLIFEIIVVTGLFLGLIFLRLYRFKFGMETATAMEAALANAPAPIPVEETTEYKELKAKFKSLEEEFNKGGASKEELEALQSKVKFLESKLLEYEILQEEIGQLSALKADNEKLKMELAKVGGTIPPSAPASASAVPDVQAGVGEGIVDSVEAAPVLAADAPAEEASATEAVPDPIADIIPAEAEDPQAAIDALVAQMTQGGTLDLTKGQPQMVVVPPAPPAPVVPPPSEEDEELKKLLAEIDSISSPK